MQRPWVDLEGSEAPQDRFAFLGRSQDLDEERSPRPGPRVFQDTINQINQNRSPEEKRPSRPLYHHQQSHGVKNALQWD
eukprot:symbB.v1.2.008910.t1/scaffold560.1/size187392/5